MVESMTLKEVRARRIQLRTEIQDLLTEFEDLTGLYVTHIVIARDNDTSSRPDIKIVELHVSLSL